MYRETVETFNAGQFTLCAGGLRALVEGICANKKIKSGPVPQRDNNGKVIKDLNGVVQMRRSKNLDGKIQGLAERGLITSAHAKAMDHFRFLGNWAVHELRIPELKNLIYAINIIEHTMTHLYDLEPDARKITKHFKKR